mgnify:CR=1 FL=1
MAARRAPADRLLTIRRYASLPSTQDVARSLAEDGAPEWTVVVAGEQTDGRGRLGNSFFSPSGGLYCSVVLRPVLPPAQAPLLGLAAGLALAEAVRDQAGLTAILKWPNDLLLAGKKVSGLLVELAASGDSIRYLVVGIGVNVNIGAFPTELETIATSLQLELGREVSLEPLRDNVLARLRSRYACDARQLLDDWRAWPNLLGRPVSVAGPDQAWKGIAEDVDTDGALLVRVEDGRLRRVVAADVHLLPTNE